MTNTPQVWPVGSVKQLLFARRFIESSAGLQFTVNPPVQCTRVNLPLLPGLHFKGYLTVLDVDGQLWLYYYTAPNGSPSGHIGMLSCLAWSDDGIDWELAPVDKFEVSGLARNNVVMPGAVGTPFIDPQETCGCRFWFAGTLGQRKEPPFWKESDDTYFGYFLTAERLRLAKPGLPRCPCRCIRCLSARCGPRKRAPADRGPRDLAVAEPAAV